MKASADQLRPSTQGSMKTFPQPPSDDNSTELHETVAGSTSTEPDSEVTPRLLDADEVPTTETVADADMAATTGTVEDRRHNTVSKFIQVGTRVEAKHNGVWYVGTVKKLPDDTDYSGMYTVLCECHGGGIVAYTPTVRLVTQVPAPMAAAAMAELADAIVATADASGSKRGVDAIASTAVAANAAGPRDTYGTENRLLKGNDLRTDALQNAALQNNRSLNFPGAATTTKEDVRRAAEAVTTPTTLQGTAKPNAEEKPARKERHLCCC